MGFEPRVGGQLARADFELKCHCRAIAVERDSALADVGRAFGEGSDEREHSRPRGTHATGRIKPLEFEDVRVRIIGVGAGQRESSVPLKPRFDVR